MLIAKFSLLSILRGLWEGDFKSWLAIGFILGCIGFFVVYEKITGKSFVKTKQERREARNRRKIVLWEYRRKSTD